MAPKHRVMLSAVGSALAGITLPITGGSLRPGEAARDVAP